MKIRTLLYNPPEPTASQVLEVFEDTKLKST